jgi:hypothetical protein
MEKVDRKYSFKRRTKSMDSFLKGFSAIQMPKIAINSSRVRNNRKPMQQSLYEDWYRIGDDMRNVMGKYEWK